MKAMLIGILKNLAMMIVGPKMILWGLRIATSVTDNKIDDNVVGIVEAGYNNDEKKLKESVEALAAIYKESK